MSNILNIIANFPLICFIILLFTKIKILKLLIKVIIIVFYISYKITKIL